MPTPPNDELTRSRAKRDEVQAKLEQGGDEEDLAYWRKVIAMWDQHITRLEERQCRVQNVAGQ